MVYMKVSASVSSLLYRSEECFNAYSDITHSLNKISKEDIGIVNINKLYLKNIIGYKYDRTDPEIREIDQTS